MYFPPAEYPEGMNIILMYPEIFNKKGFRELIDLLGERFWDLDLSGMFLFASLQQANYGASLVMLLSAIERSSTKCPYNTLEQWLSRSEFIEKMNKLRGDETGIYLKNEIKEYNSRYGSFNAVSTFYLENTTEEEKITLINSVVETPYKFSISGDMRLYTPVPSPYIYEYDKALKNILRKVIYDIRNTFVHRAGYIPFPDGIFNKFPVSYKNWEGIHLRSEWRIKLKFETLHNITRSAFIRYWKKEIDKL